MGNYRQPSSLVSRDELNDAEEDGLDILEGGRTKLDQLDWCEREREEGERVVEKERIELAEREKWR